MPRSRLLPNRLRNKPTLHVRRHSPRIGARTRTCSDSWPHLSVWCGVALRCALRLSSLGRNQRVATFLDRRVDPGTPVDFTARNIPLQDALQQLTTDRNLGLAFVGPVVYLGPAGPVSKLATLLETQSDQLIRLPAAARSRLARRRPWQWPDLAEPRQLLQQLGQDGGIQILGSDAVPHDLWPAADLPPLTVPQRLTLLLAGFDLTYELLADGSAARLVPIPAEVTLRRTYAAGRNAPRVAQTLARVCPDAKIVNQGSQVVVEATAEQHAKIVALLAAEPAEPGAAQPGRQQRFSLRMAGKPAQSLLARAGQRTVPDDPGRAQRGTATETVDQPGSDRRHARRAAGCRPRPSGLNPPAARQRADDPRPSRRGGPGASEAVAPLGAVTAYIVRFGVGWILIHPGNAGRIKIHPTRIGPIILSRLISRVVPCELIRSARHPRRRSMDIPEDRLERYMAEVRQQVCSRCIERSPGTPPCAPQGKQCGIELHLAQIVQVCHAARGRSIEPYVQRFHDDVCTHCVGQTTGDCPCPLDYLLLLAVEAIEEVDRRMAEEQTQEVD